METENKNIMEYVSIKPNTTTETKEQKTRTQTKRKYTLSFQENLIYITETKFKNNNKKETEFYLTTTKTEFKNFCIVMNSIKEIKKFYSDKKGRTKKKDLLNIMTKKILRFNTHNRNIYLNPFMVLKLLNHYNIIKTTTEKQQSKTIKTIKELIKQENYYKIKTSKYKFLSPEYRGFKDTEKITEYKIKTLLEQQKNQTETLFNYLKKKDLTQETKTERQNIKETIENINTIPLKKYKYFLFMNSNLKKVFQIKNNNKVVV
jgi:hypothetical protein